MGGRRYLISMPWEKLPALASMVLIAWPATLCWKDWFTVFVLQMYLSNEMFLLLGTSYVMGFLSFPITISSGEKTTHRAMRMSLQPNRSNTNCAKLCGSMPHFVVTRMDC